MNDLVFHIGLFLFSTLVIVAISCMFTEADDQKALRLFPRRYLTFVVVPSAVVTVLLVVEHTFASVS